MATRQVRTDQRRNAYERRTMGNSSYVYGNTVRKLDVTTAIEEEPRKKLSNATRKNREKAARMSLGYVMFLAVAMMVSAGVLIGYIQLQSDNTMAMEKIASMESELNDLRLKNNEEYSRAVSNVDLEEVKRIAIEELGMKYAEEGQVIQVEGAKDDYVRQYTEMP
ncbi:MAG: cell division protein FtsL [Lachnospiraceae bacterium]|nr:cell division protein FtsL [Lachnospiraceae bacterium]